MKDFRIEEIKFMSEINQIVKDNFRLFPQDITHVKLSTSDEDTRESFDLVYNSSVEISIRIRNNSYLKYADFTIRSKSFYRQKTEIDKLKEGLGSIYLYAWKTPDDSKFESWILVDINKFRPAIEGYPVTDRFNPDTTAFKPYPLAVIISYDALINYCNLPAWCLPSPNWYKSLGFIPSFLELQNSSRT